MKSISIIIFIVSSLIHVLTFFPIDQIHIEYVFFMQMFCIIICSIMFFHFRSINKDEKRIKGHPYSIIASDIQKFTLYLKSIPKYKGFSLCICFVYMFLNFALLSSNTEVGNHEFIDVSYVLVSGGTILRSITLDEYLNFNKLVVRGFSGHWMFFSLLPTVFYLNLDVIKGMYEKQTDNQSLNIGRGNSAATS